MEGDRIFSVILLWTLVALGMGKIVPGIQLQRRAPDGHCSLKRFDLVFVLDSSYSVSDTDFQSLKNFAVSITTGLRRNGVKTEIGAVTFGGNATTRIRLDNEMCPMELAAAIRAIPHTKEYDSNVHLGFHLARQQLGQGQPCEKCGIAKGIVLLIEGTPTDVEAAYIESKVALDKGIEVYVVAVGKGHAPGEHTVQQMSVIYTGGEVDHVTRVSEAKALRGFVNTITSQICKGKRQKRSIEDEVVTQISQQEYDALLPGFMKKKRDFE